MQGRAGRGHRGRGGVAWALALLLSACGGGGDGGAGGLGSALSGLAAVGAGIANGTVTARCVAGPVITGSTDANGSFSLQLGSSTAPCMVQVSGGTPAVTLYSFAEAAGRVNITPATDLVVARALGADPDAQFAAFDATRSNTVRANLAAAKTYVGNQLSSIAGASLGQDPLTGVFAVGDADDKLLDALGAAMQAAGKTVADLRPQAVSSSSLVATVPAYLAAPGGVSATAQSASQISLAWTAVAGASSYRVFRSTSSPVGTGGSPVGTSSSTSYSDSGLTASSLYYYKVVPANSVLNAGQASGEVSATTQAPAASLTVSGVSPGSAAVGATVTITGSGFDADPFHMQVRFSHNVAASVVSSTSTSVVVTVPAGAVSGAITVSNTLSGASATSGSSFTVSAGGAGGGSWVARASPAAYLLNGLAYGNSVFVAVGYNRTILTSGDGISWTARTAPDSLYTDTRAVAWTGSEFVLVGDKTVGAGTIPTVATSPDGVTWTRRAWTSNTASDTVNAVGTGAGKLMVGTLGGALAYSTDGGASWTAETQTHISQFNGFAGHSTTRVAVGSNASSQGAILYDSGSGWTAVTGLAGIVPRAVVWTGTQFVAVGSSMAGLGNPVSASSPDGVSWTVHALGTSEAPAGYPLVAVLYSGSALYATGDNFGNKHVIVKSVDGGASWSSVYSATVSGNAMLAGLAASGTRIVTVGGVKSVTLP